MEFHLFLLILAITQAAKGKKMTIPKEGLSPIDPSSYSRPEFAIVKHIAINLNVNFDKKILSGDVNLTVEKADKTASELVLDSLDLNIQSIYDADTKNELSYTVGDRLLNYGSKISIKLPENDAAKYVIGIKYETSPEATGLQWLSPSQTAGKKHPYLFSQFEPIHARSVFPCQDTPAVKTTYTATISAPPEFTVLMSALRDGTKEMQGGKLSHFSQKVPMPAYLFAIAVGVLESRKIGPRSTVWSEKEIIEECAYEFADTEKQLKTAEDICGPYVWGIYDLLVLPPSFPFGGMENPCLTFVTPTLLAGDRSLANVVAHEIAHSWTGNLITNRNFEHFWLNEGFTVFIERKIKGRLESPQSQDLDAYSHISELKEAIERIGVDSPLTQLVMDLKGVHPDDSFSTVPYEKGSIFLRYLEDVVGGPSKFEPFLRKYFDLFKYKSIVTDDFVKTFKEHFQSNSAIKDIDWDKWLYSPGMPIVIPNFDKSLAVICEDLVDKFVKWDGSGKIPISNEERKNLTTSQTIYVLQKLIDCDAQSIDKLKALAKLFNLNDVKNSEIKFRWFRIALKAKFEEVIDPVFHWLNEVGRMKFTRPLYRDLYAWEKTREGAIENFKANRKNMMHVSAHVLAMDLKLE